MLNQCTAAAVRKAGEPPIIDEQPIGRAVTDGGHVTLSVLARSTVPMSFQWWKGNERVTNSTRISGATNFVLNIDPVQLNDTGDYFAVVSSTGGATTSAVVSVTVNPIARQLIVRSGGLLIRMSGQIGDVYRIEASTGPTGPWSTNGYATNFFGVAEYFFRFGPDSGFFQILFDHMLPVLYPAGLGSVRAYGKLNQAWRFQFSSDLKAWNSFGVMTNVTGWVTFSDPRDFIPSEIFYRIAPP